MTFCAITKQKYTLYDQVLLKHIWIWKWPKIMLLQSRQPPI